MKESYMSEQCKHYKDIYILDRIQLFCLERKGDSRNVRAVMKSFEMGLLNVCDFILKNYGY